MDDIPSEALRALVAEEWLREAVSALANHGIPCAPMKSVLLRALVGQLRRPFGDVDILVPPAFFELASEALIAAGLSPSNEHESARTFIRAGRPLSLDLHRAPFPVGLFDLDAEGLFERGVTEDALFGVPVVRLDPRDVYALAVGHFAKDRRDGRYEAHLLEIVDLGHALAVAPKSVARHLDDHGLGRAARFVLRLTRNRHDDAFSASVLASLRPDPLGDALSVAAHRYIGLFPTPSKLAAPATHLLNRTLPRGARSFVRHARRPARALLLRATGRTTGQL